MDTEFPAQIYLQVNTFSLRLFHTFDNNIQTDILLSQQHPFILYTKTVKT